MKPFRVILTYREEEGTRQELPINLDYHASVFHAEITAIMACAEDIVWRPYTNKRINSLTLQRVPEHCGAQGNKKTDDLTKISAKRHPVDPEPTCEIAYLTAKLTMKELLRKQHLACWRDLPGLRQS